MSTRPAVFLSLLSILVLGTGCPEDVPDDGTGANGQPNAAGGGAAGGGTQTGAPGGGPHDCSNPMATQASLEEQGAESLVLTVTGSVACTTCTGGVTLNVIAPPPVDATADQQPDPHGGCISFKQVADLTSFTVLLPVGLDKVNIQSVDTAAPSNWGLAEVPLGAGGAQNVALDTSVKPAGEAITSTGERLGVPDGDTTGTLPEDGGEENSDGTDVEAVEGSTAADE